MNELIISVSQVPGQVTFDNYESVKAELEEYIEEKYSYTNYKVEQTRFSK